MPAFDIKEGKMQMRFLKPTVQQPRSMVDYLKTDFEVLEKGIHPIDQIELHKQIGEMVYSMLTNKAITGHQLQNSLNNTFAQLQLEKASSQAKDTRIKTLEDLFIELGHDLKDVKVAEQLIKKKNDDIAALKKQLKIPPLYHPQTAEVLEKQKEEELMDLVLKSNDQLKESEKELENLIQSKQSELATTPQTVIPTVSTSVTSTLATSLAPTIPTVIALLVLGTTSAIGTSTSIGITTEKTDELVKVMEQMSIQATKLKKLREKVTSLETSCSLAQIQHKEETRKNQRMVEIIRILENDLTLEKPLGDIKDILWTNIIHSINDIWPSI